MVYIGNDGYKGMNGEIADAITSLDGKYEILKKWDTFWSLDIVNKIENYLIKRDCFELQPIEDGEFSLSSFDIAFGYYMICSKYSKLGIKEFKDLLDEITLNFGIFTNQTVFDYIYKTDGLLELYKFLKFEFTPDNDFYVEDNVLYGLTVDGYLKNLKKISIPNSTNTISDGAFHSNKDVEEVYIPSSVETIEYGAFRHCSNLSKVSFNEGLKEIGENAFQYCNIEQIILPKSLKKLDPYAFDGNPLKMIDIPSSIKYKSLENLCDCKIVFHDVNQIKKLKKLEQNNNKLVGIDETTNEIFYSTN